MSLLPFSPAIECGVLSHGAAEVTLDNVAALRDDPCGASGVTIPPRFLRYADEQTVVALAAVTRAMAARGLGREDLRDWGVVAATRFTGRVACAGAFAKFHRDGPATVSPHIIPQHSLHSVASAISVALGMRGPNLGVGGGIESVSEGLLAGLTFFDQAAMSGLWLVLSHWEPEPVPDGAGSSPTPSVCRAVALALTRAADAALTLRLRTAGDLATASATAPRLDNLVDWLREPSSAWSAALPWGGIMEMTVRKEIRRQAA